MNSAVNNSSAALESKSHQHTRRIRANVHVIGDEMGSYVSAMHWKELTTSSGPLAAKKLS